MKVVLEVAEDLVEQIWRRRDEMIGLGKSEDQLG